MAGSTSIPARRAFAESLLEKLFGLEAEVIKPFQTLDQGVSGYSFDLVPLRLSLAEQSENAAALTHIIAVPSFSNSEFPPECDSALPYFADQLPLLLQTSLESLLTTEPRLVSTVNSPHDILDARWAQRVGDIGISLDFTFPASPSTNLIKPRSNGKLDIGRNLYDDSYTCDFSSFSSVHCECRACAPIAPSTQNYHDADDPSYTNEREVPSSQKRVKTLAYP